MERKVDKFVGKIGKVFDGGHNKNKGYNTNQYNTNINTGYNTNQQGHKPRE